MNIFVLSYDPVRAAQMQCDKHVVKMILESAQLLSTAHHEFDSPYKDQCYRPTHKNHPCAKWVRESADNYFWLYDHLLALGEEYTYRYGKIHKTIRERADVLQFTPLGLEATGYTQFPLCMPDEYKIYDDIGDTDVVGSYRAYYIGEKAYFATWKKRNPPYWWTGHSKWDEEQAYEDSDSV